MANNSFATFFGATYPATSDVLNTAPTYGDTQNVLNGTYDPGGGGTVPSADDVREGVAVGQGGTGNLRVPAEGNVRQSVVYDSTNPGLEKTGLLDLPSVNDVEKGVPFDQTTKIGTFGAPAEIDVRTGVGYGANDTEFVGTLDVSGDPPQFPSEDDVRLGVTFGTDANPTQYTGNCRVPPVERVQSGYPYDSNDSLTGTFLGSGDYPPITAVLDGVSYADGQLVGVYVPADTAVVKLGEQYGANGTQFVGTYQCTDPDAPGGGWIG